MPKEKGRDSKDIKDGCGDLSHGIYGYIGRVDGLGNQIWEGLRH